ncbi:hypothetical protein [Burkholderia oklahomensis]|uniref:hypothetical protein n=1 Tax=Burkholderia oklahomensis TaxID=342113 RepID=UPI0002D6E72E|nr:hypothetical protein [Burkholderia oklahomensis]
MADYVGILAALFPRNRLTRRLLKSSLKKGTAATGECAQTPRVTDCAARWKST